MKFTALVALLFSLASQSAFAVENVASINLKCEAVLKCGATGPCSIGPKLTFENFQINGEVFNFTKKGLIPVIDGQALKLKETKADAGITVGTVDTTRVSCSVGGYGYQLPIRLDDNLSVLRLLAKPDKN